MRYEEISLLYCSDLFLGILSKIKSFTGGHVCETGQKVTTVMKEECTSQRRFRLYLVQ